MRKLVVGVYCIKDDLEGFMSPWCMTEDPSALRQFEDVIKKDGTMFNMHPEQFNLFKIGTLDTETGDIVPCMEFLANGSTYRSVING